MGLDLHGVRQINGDLRIDDGDEGPMLKIQFFDTWARELTNGERDEILVVVVAKLSEVLRAKNGPDDKDCDRKGAIEATRANNVG